MKIMSSFITITAISPEVSSNMPHGYLIGGTIGLLILAYLVYTLVKPEKF